jgi:transcriptional regulator with XRE-family HTH domain
LEFRQRLADRVKQARERLGLTQARFAEAVGFPGPQTVSDIEHGQRELHTWELVNVARVLKLSIQDLLGEQEVSTPTVLWRMKPSGASIRRLTALSVPAG